MANKAKEVYGFFSFFLEPCLTALQLKKKKHSPRLLKVLCPKDGLSRKTIRARLRGKMASIASVLPRQNEKPQTGGRIKVEITLLRTLESRSALNTMCLQRSASLLLIGSVIQLALLTAWNTLYLQNYVHVIKKGLQEIKYSQRDRNYIKKEQVIGIVVKTTVGDAHFHI